MDRNHHLALFLRNRLTKPTEGRHFRTHGIVHTTSKPMARKRIDWVEVAFGVAAVVVFTFMGFMLGARG